MTDRPMRNRFCCCSRAQSASSRARAACTLHGTSDEAKAYRAGVADALSGVATEVPKAPRVVEGEDELTAPLRAAVAQAAIDERARLAWWLRAGLTGPAAMNASEDYLSAIRDLADVIEQHPERWIEAPTSATSEGTR